MLLGDILRTFSDETTANEYLLAIGDLPLIAGLRERAIAEGVTLGEYAGAAVQRYATQASDEEWVTLLGLVSRTDDPATACLRRALEYSVAMA